MFAAMGHWACNPLIRTTAPGVAQRGRQRYRGVEAWPTLPPAIREAILAMLRAAE